jgi:hypothetical protein
MATIPFSGSHVHKAKVLTVLPCSVLGVAQLVTWVSEPTVTLASPVEEAYKGADASQISELNNLTDSLLYSLWSHILTLAQRIPSSGTSHLVSVMKLLKSRPSPIFEDAACLETLKESYRPWSIDNGRLGLSSAYSRGPQERCLTIPRSVKQLP